MIPGDHTRTLEAMPVGAAEEWAVEDCRAYFGMLASNAEKARHLPSERSACDADATGLQGQTCGRREDIASGKEQIL